MDYTDFMWIINRGKWNLDCVRIICTAVFECQNHAIFNLPIFVTAGPLCYFCRVFVFLGVVKAAFCRLFLVLVFEAALFEMGHFFLLAAVVD